MEFGARVKGVVNDMIFSLNYFNGLSNSGQLKLIGAPDVTVAPDGTPVLHLPLEERFPRVSDGWEPLLHGELPSVSSTPWEEWHRSFRWKRSAYLTTRWGSTPRRPDRRLEDTSRRTSFRYVVAGWTGK